MHRERNLTSSFTILAAVACVVLAITWPSWRAELGAQYYYYSPSPGVSTTPAITATPASSPSTSPTASVQVPSVQCYDVQTGPVPALHDIAVEDEFGPSTVELIGPKRICNPASVNDSDPNAPTNPDHLVGYKLRQREPFTRMKDQRISDAFGQLTVDVVKPELLLVPSTKSVTAPPPPVTTFGIDHFKCYGVKRGRRNIRGLHIEDQFGPLTVEVKKPKRLCVPASKNGEPVLDRVTHLMCYEARIASMDRPFVAPEQLFIANQFGETSIGRFRPTELCVPAVLNP